MNHSLIYAVKRYIAIILAIVLAIGCFPATSYAETEITPSSFSDMPSQDRWSYNALVSAVENGILRGTDGKLNPKNSVTRAELATMINRIAGATEKANISQYKDVVSWKWYHSELAKAVQMKTLNGVDESHLNPTGYVTREQAFTIIGRFIKLSTDDFSSINSFSDVSSIRDYAKPYIAALVSSGYVSGNGGKLNPQANITREEIAQIFYNIFNQYICDEGTYNGELSGNILVNTDGVSFKDATITGDVIIGEGVGDGEVTFDNTTIAGRLIVRGGGANSIKIVNNSSVGSVVVCKTASGSVRVLASDGARVDVLQVEDGADAVKIEGTYLTVEVQSATEVVVDNATVSQLTISAENANVDVQSGTIASVSIESTATGATMSTAEGSKVGTIEVESNAQLNVSGTVAQISISESSDAGSAQLNIGDTAKIDKIAASEGANVTLNVADNASINTISGDSKSITINASSDKLQEQLESKVTEPEKESSKDESKSSDTTSDTNPDPVVDPIVIKKTATVVSADEFNQALASSNVSELIINEDMIIAGNVTLDKNLIINKGVTIAFYDDLDIKSSVINNGNIVCIQSLNVYGTLKNNGSIVNEYGYSPINIQPGGVINGTSTTIAYGSDYSSCDTYYANGTKGLTQSYTVGSNVKLYTSGSNLAYVFGVKGLEAALESEKDYDSIVISEDENSSYNEINYSGNYSIDSYISISNGVTLNILTGNVLETSKDINVNGSLNIQSEATLKALTMYVYGTVINNGTYSGVNKTVCYEDDTLYQADGTIATSGTSSVSGISANTLEIITGMDRVYGSLGLSSYLSTQNHLSRLQLYSSERGVSEDISLPSNISDDIRLIISSNVNLVIPNGVSADIESISIEGNVNVVTGASLIADDISIEGSLINSGTCKALNTQVVRGLLSNTGIFHSSTIRKGGFSDTYYPDGSVSGLSTVITGVGYVESSDNQTANVYGQKGLDAFVQTGKKYDSIVLYAYDDSISIKSNINCDYIHIYGCYDVNITSSAHVVTDSLSLSVYSLNIQNNASVYSETHIYAWNTTINNNGNVQSETLDISQSEINNNNKITTTNLTVSGLSSKINNKGTFKINSYYGDSSKSYYFADGTTFQIGPSVSGLNFDGIDTYTDVEAYAYGLVGLQNAIKAKDTLSTINLFPDNNMSEITVSESLSCNNLYVSSGTKLNISNGYSIKCNSLNVEGQVNVIDGAVLNSSTINIYGIINNSGTVHHTGNLTVNCNGTLNNLGHIECDGSGTINICSDATIYSSENVEVYSYNYGYADEYTAEGEYISANQVSNIVINDKVTIGASNPNLAYIYGTKGLDKAIELGKSYTRVYFAKDNDTRAYTGNNIISVNADANFDNVQIEQGVQLSIDSNSLFVSTGYMDVYGKLNITSGASVNSNYIAAYTDASIINAGNITANKIYCSTTDYYYANGYDTLNASNTIIEGVSSEILSDNKTAEVYGSDALNRAYASDTKYSTINLYGNPNNKNEIINPESLYSNVKYLNLYDGAKYVDSCGLKLNNLYVLEGSEFSVADNSTFESKVVSNDGTVNIDGTLYAQNLYNNNTLNINSGANATISNYLDCYEGFINNFGELSFDYANISGSTLTNSGELSARNCYINKSTITNTGTIDCNRINQGSIIDYYYADGTVSRTNENTISGIDESILSDLTYSAYAYGSVGLSKLLESQVDYSFINIGSSGVTANIDLTESIECNQVNIASDVNLRVLQGMTLKASYIFLEGKLVICEGANLDADYIHVEGTLINNGSADVTTVYTQYIHDYYYANGSKLINENRPKINGLSDSTNIQYNSYAHVYGQSGLTQLLKSGIDYDYVSLDGATTDLVLSQNFATKNLIITSDVNLIIKQNAVLSVTTQITVDYSGSLNVNSGATVSGSSIVVRGKLNNEGIFDVKIIEDINLADSYYADGTKAIYSDKYVISGIDSAKLPSVNKTAYIYGNAGYTLWNDSQIKYNDLYFCAASNSDKNISIGSSIAAYNLHIEDNTIVSIADEVEVSVSDTTYIQGTLNVSDDGILDTKCLNISGSVNNEGTINYASLSNKIYYIYDYYRSDPDDDQINSITHQVVGVNGYNNQLFAYVYNNEALERAVESGVDYDAIYFCADSSKASYTIDFTLACDEIHINENASVAIVVGGTLQPDNLNIQGELEVKTNGTVIASYIYVYDSGVLKNSGTVSCNSINASNPTDYYQKNGTVKTVDTEITGVTQYKSSGFRSAVVYNTTGLDALINSGIVYSDIQIETNSNKTETVVLNNNLTARYIHIGNSISFNIPVNVTAYIYNSVHVFGNLNIAEGGTLSTRYLYVYGNINNKGNVEYTSGNVGAQYDYYYEDGTSRINTKNYIISGVNLNSNNTAYVYGEDALKKALASNNNYSNYVLAKASNNNIILPESMDISGTITIESGVKLTIPSGSAIYAKSMNCYGSLTIDGDAFLTLSGRLLISQGELINNGNILCQYFNITDGSAFGNNGCELGENSKILNNGHMAVGTVDDGYSHESCLSGPNASLVQTENAYLAIYDGLRLNNGSTLDIQSDVLNGSDGNHGFYVNNTVYINGTYYASESYNPIIKLTTGSSISKYYSTATVYSKDVISEAREYGYTHIYYNGELVLDENWDINDYVNASTITIPENTTITIDRNIDANTITILSGAAVTFAYDDDYPTINVNQGAKIIVSSGTSISFTQLINNGIVENNGVLTHRDQYVDYSETLFIPDYGVVSGTAIQTKYYVNVYNYDDFKAAQDRDFQQINYYGLPLVVSSNLEIKHITRLNSPVTVSSGASIILLDDLYTNYNVKIDGTMTVNDNAYYYGESGSKLTLSSNGAINLNGYMRLNDAQLDGSITFDSKGRLDLLGEVYMNPLFYMNLFEFESQALNIITVSNDSDVHQLCNLIIPKNNCLAIFGNYEVCNSLVNNGYIRVYKSSTAYLDIMNDGVLDNCGTLEITQGQVVINGGTLNNTSSGAINNNAIIKKNSGTYINNGTTKGSGTYPVTD